MAPNVTVLVSKNNFVDDRTPVAVVINILLFMLHRFLRSYEIIKY